MAVADKRAAGEASQAQPPAKKSASAAAAHAAASGAPPLAPVAPLCITQLLETESSMQRGQFSQWVRKVKNYVDQALLGFLQERKRELSFALPQKCSMIPPLAISQAASRVPSVRFAR